jgi:hypothetical protein
MESIRFIDVISWTESVGCSVFEQRIPVSLDRGVSISMYKSPSMPSLLNSLPD